VQRLGVIGIIIEKDRSKAELVQNLLSQFGDMILGRMGLPYPQNEVFIISLIVKGTNEQISALSGKIGKIQGVKIKTALTDALIVD